MTNASRHLLTLKRLSLPASRRVPVDTAEYQRALTYAIRAIEDQDRLRAALIDLIDAIPVKTLDADPPLRAWVDMAEDVLAKTETERKQR